MLKLAKYTARQWKIYFPSVICHVISFKGQGQLTCAERGGGGNL